MAQPARQTRRIFKTAWFAKAVRKAGIEDFDLCKAIDQVIKGQADDLGGGVFKKRLKQNIYRSIILAKGGQYWLYEYLFAKKDRENIETSELKAFRELAKGYHGLTRAQLARLLKDEDLMEACHDDKTPIQE